MKGAVRVEAEDFTTEWDDAEWGTDEDVANFDEEVDVDRIEAALKAADSAPAPQPANKPRTLAHSGGGRTQLPSRATTNPPYKPTSPTHSSPLSAMAPFVEDRSSPKIMSLGKKGKERAIPKEDEEDEVVAFDVTEITHQDHAPPPTAARDTQTTGKPLSPTPIMPRIELNLEAASVSPSSRYSSFLTLRRMSYSVKIITAVHLLSSTYFALLPSFWWAVFFAVVFTPLGFWGAHSYKAKVMFVYVVHIALNTLLAMLLLLLSLAQVQDKQDKIGLPEVVLGIVFITAEIFMLHYCYTFWKLLPKNMDFQAAFKQFFSSPYSRLGAIGGGDDATNQV
eukprot:TRINITY_DN8429_c0_g1_i2.p1 TRINITY_DN8429_c0_g1~~TRINITY_DN8429_c0_g1_i2.p1  ORF type:complete len:337 (-),score=76.85 TRINITY_DN8429_c0_g1_i2:140-1150(-)